MWCGWLVGWLVGWVGARIYVRVFVCVYVCARVRDRKVRKNGWGAFERVRTDARGWGLRTCSIRRPFLQSQNNRKFRPKGDIDRPILFWQVGREAPLMFPDPRGSHVYVPVPAGTYALAQSTLQLWPGCRMEPGMHPLPESVKSWAHSSAKVGSVHIAGDGVGWFVAWVCISVCVLKARMLEASGRAVRERERANEGERIGFAKCALQASSIGGPRERCSRRNRR